MAKRDELAQLRAVPLFRDLTDKDLRPISKVLNEQRFRAGQVIISEGVKGSRFFLITDGQATVRVGDRVVQTVGPGDFVGEMALFDDSPRAATVQADTDVTALTAASWNFNSMLAENWPVTKKILAELARRVRAADGETRG
jgi:CRP-like cAMP-binding protein